jgi:neopullulanase
MLSTADGRTDEQNEIVDHIKALLDFRQMQPALHYGWMKHFVPQDNVYTYFRYDDESTIMVVINSNEEEKALDTSRFRESTVWHK